jgi:HNH endonuclease/CENP-B-like protein
MRREYAPVQLKPSLDRYGYPCLNVSSVPGRHHNHPVHALVAVAFLGPRPKGLVVCHRDGDKTNNRPANLMYATQAENVRQGMESGRMVRGDRSHLAKLTDRQAMEIVHRIEAGEAQAALAREFGVTENTIWSIKTGRTRRHLNVVPTRSEEIA